VANRDHSTKDLGITGNPSFCLVGLLGCTSTENIKFGILQHGFLSHDENAQMQCLSGKFDCYCKGKGDVINRVV
jgi:hypothetical protein